MDDLISRKAAIEAIASQSIYETREVIAEALLNDYKKSDEWLGGIDDAISAIEEMNAVPAAPLDKLCEWLAEHSVIIPCETCRHCSNGYCLAVGDMDTPCPNKAEDWQRAIKEWMEETENDK